MPAVCSISASLPSPRRYDLRFRSSNWSEQVTLNHKVSGSNPGGSIQRDDRKDKQSLACPIGLVGLGRLPLTQEDNGSNPLWDAHRVGASELATQP